MSKISHKYRIFFPQIILGVPLEQSENPFLVVPVCQGIIAAKLESCNQKHVKISNNDDIVYPLINSFYDALEDLTENICLDLTLERSCTLGPSSLYASISTIILYLIGKFHGETLEPLEIIELGRYADSFEKPSGWQYSIDAIRYSVLKGKPVVFRNDEEFAIIDKVKITETGKFLEVYRANQLLKRRDIGGEIYNAIVKLVGVLVLEGVVKLREEGLIPLISSLGRIQNGIVSMVWGLSLPGEGCIISPGLPGSFEKVCW